jgi:hypothetical protein
MPLFGARHISTSSQFMDCTYLAPWNKETFTLPNKYLRQISYSEYWWNSMNGNGKKITDDEHAIGIVNKYT